MNEVVAVRMSNWQAMIHDRNESGLSVKDWCAANNVTESQYYYRLKQLRNAAFKAMDQTQSEEACGFTKIPISTTSSDVALRIRRADTTIDVSGDAPDRILSFLKAVMTDAF